MLELVDVDLDRKKDLKIRRKQKRYSSLLSSCQSGSAWSRIGNWECLVMLELGNKTPTRSYILCRES